MLKLAPIYHQGIEFIQLSMLPFDQAAKLKKWLADADIFNLFVGQEALEGCVHYDDYEFWCDTLPVEYDQYELV